MARERSFRFLLAPAGQGVLLERVTKTTTANQSKISVIYALDSELRLVAPIVPQADRMVASSDVVPQPAFSSVSGRTPYYYPLSSLTYVVEHTTILSPGRPAKTQLHLYIPLSATKSSLTCRDVSFIFPRQLRGALSERFMDYAVSRV